MSLMVFSALQSCELTIQPTLVRLSFQRGGNCDKAIATCIDLVALITEIDLETFAIRTQQLVTRREAALLQFHISDPHSMRL